MIQTAMNRKTFLVDSISPKLADIPPLALKEQLIVLELFDQILLVSVAITQL